MLPNDTGFVPARLQGRHIALTCANHSAESEDVLAAAPFRRFSAYRYGAGPIEPSLKI